MSAINNKLILRLKTCDGQFILNQLTSNSTLEELCNNITLLTGIPQVQLRILSGFPHSAVDITDLSKLLSTVGIKSGDSLLVEQDNKTVGQNHASVVNPPDRAMDAALQSQLNSSASILTRRTVPANNSCLFTSINLLMEHGKLDLECSPSLRQLIAGVVMSDTESYSEAFLGKDNDAYCTWIMDASSWGGAIEISILSKYYQVEIAVVDTQTVRVDRFGEDQGYSQRIFVIYDGVHYDPLILDHADPSLPLKTIFSTNDAIVLSQALELAAEAKASRQFTDVNRFTLRCLICQKCLAGQDEAQDHAKVTGHINFGEVE